MRDQERVSRIQQALHSAGLDAIVCALPGNVLLLTGYWPVVGSSIAIATRGGEISVIAPEDEIDLAQQGWAEVQAFRPSSLDKLSDAAEQVREPLRNILSKLGMQHGNIGYEDGMTEPSSYAGMMIYGPTIVSVLADIAPDAKCVASSDMLAGLRAVKTPRELDCIRRSCAVAAEAFEQGARGIRVGMRETEAAGIFQPVLKIKGTEVASRAGGFVFCMSGTNSAQAYGAYARSRCRRIEEGDLVLVHCNSYTDGFWTDITRTYTAGAENARAREMREAVFAARAAALAVVRPGVKASDVDHAARQELKARGFGPAFKHSTGHGVGFAAIDPSARPRLHPKSADVLEAGMVFNVEPAIYIENFGGLRHCDVVAVSSHGAEVLTDFQSKPEKLAA